MKKLFVICFLAVFTFGFGIDSAHAILEGRKIKKEQKEKTILDYINFDWWKKSNDPYLEKYIVSAINNNNDIKTAALKIEQAKINVTAQRADLMPNISVGAAPFLTKIPMTPEGTTKSQGSIAIPFIANWELDLFGKNYDKTKSSKILLQSAVYSAAASDISIVSMVGAVYYNIVKLDKMIDLQEDITKDRKEIYDLMKLSNEAGIVSTSDLIQAEKSYVLSQNDLLDYKKARESALNALAVLIGDSPNNTKEYQRIFLDDLDSNFVIPQEISSEIITNRPDYKATEKQLEASGFDIRAAKKEFLPTINILGLLSFAATSTQSTMNWANSLALLGGSANLPLFTGFKRVANLKMHKNRYEQLLQQYQKTNLVSIQEVNDSLYNFKSDNEKFLNNKKAFEIQNQDYKYSQSKYNQGVISKLDLLQQKEALLYIEQLLASSKTDCYMDKISLYKTTGARI